MLRCLTHTVRLSFVWWDYPLWWFPRTFVLVNTFNLDERWQENLDVKSRKNRAFCLFSAFACSCSFLSVAEPSLFFLHPPRPRQRSLLLYISSASCFYWLHIYYGNLSNGMKCNIISNIFTPGTTQVDWALVSKTEVLKYARRLVQPYIALIYQFGVW